jgi:MFS transporter, DHA2 family, metal-tetracycline-proton antiporter
MVTRMLPAGRRGLAFGLIATGTGFAQAAGPILGGLIGQLAGWRALFMVTAFLTLPVLAGALWLLPGREKWCVADGVNSTYLAVP